MPKLSNPLFKVASTVALHLPQRALDAIRVLARAVESGSAAEEALRMLYGLDIGLSRRDDPQYEKDFVDTYWEGIGAMRRFKTKDDYEAVVNATNDIVNGIRSNLGMIDNLIGEVGRTSLSRLSPVERSLVRLGTWLMVSAMNPSPSGAVVFPSMKFVKEALRSPEETSEDEFRGVREGVINTIDGIANKYREGIDQQTEEANPVIKGIVADVGRAIAKAWALQTRADQPEVAREEESPPEAAVVAVAARILRTRRAR